MKITEDMTDEQARAVYYRRMIRWTWVAAGGCAVASVGNGLSGSWWACALFALSAALQAVTALTYSSAR